jgi:type II secretory ATPase GspE/PulE/Tfp pilus assembly ATPase PilB-like protein
MINIKASLEEVRLLAISEGFREMHVIALEKVRLGITTLDEVSHATRMTF